MQVGCGGGVTPGQIGSDDTRALIRKEKRRWNAAEPHSGAASQRVFPRKQQQIPGGVEPAGALWTGREGPHLPTVAAAEFQLRAKEEEEEEEEEPNKPKCFFLQIL